MKNLIELFLHNPIIFFIIAVFFFFYPFFLQGKIPIPADTIVGMYHPFRDVVWDNYIAGVPFKNFLITDPVRQQYVWRELAVEELKKGKLPLWNPYSFAGVPLLANFQTASFYPFNVLFFALPFNFAWGILIVLQSLFAGIFLYLYLRCLKIHKLASILGSLTFSFSGFIIAWLEWNTIVHTALWLPLLLLSIEKIIGYFKKNLKTIKQYSKSKLKVKNLFFWSALFVFSLIASFFAGHLQIFFYSFLVVMTYIIIRVLSLSYGKVKVFLLFAFCFLFFVLITSLQWLPTFQFIQLSARNIDQNLWQKEGWFLPWQNLVQFVAPDFFGNPATGNYWGIWNYGEFIGYVGIIPLIFALYALIVRRDKKVSFFGILVFIALIFALPTFLAKLPYQWQIPFIATSQPTRLLFIVDFSLAVLAALGFDYFLKNKNLMIQKIGFLIVASLVGGVFLFLWFYLFFLSRMAPENFLTTKRNLILPTILFLGAFLSIFLFLIKDIAIGKLRENKRGFFSFFSFFGNAGENWGYFLLLVFTFFDLFRFGWKFTPFVKREWIFPSTRLIDLLKEEKDNFRILSLDRRIMPPNFSVAYRLQDVSGYDPLYLKNYSQLVSAWERGRPDIFLASFNRIITPINYENFITDFLGVKYLMSLSPIESEKLELIAVEGITHLYKNKKAFPRAFLVEEVVRVKDEQQEIEKMFILGEKLREIATTTEFVDVFPKKLQIQEEVVFEDYQPNYLRIKVKVQEKRVLVLTDIYYPSWRAFIDGKEEKIIKVDFAFRGIVVPAGEHTVEFRVEMI